LSVEIPEVIQTRFKVLHKVQSISQFKGTAIFERVARSSKRRNKVLVSLKVRQYKAQSISQFKGTAIFERTVSQFKGTATGDKRVSQFKGTATETKG